MEENIVKQVCKELNINQAELAKKLDVSTSAIAQWNTRKIPKMVHKTLEYMLKLNEREQQLKKIKEFYRALKELDKM